MIEHFYANSIQEYNQELQAREKEREAQKLEEIKNREELSKKSAEAINITIMSIVFGIVGLIILIVLYYYGRKFLQYLGIIPKENANANENANENPHANAHTNAHNANAHHANAHHANANANAHQVKVMELSHVETFKL